MTSPVLSILLTFACSTLFCGVYLRLARRWRILDVPNERSSHEQPTPRGGGLPLMLAFFLGLAWVFGLSVFWSSQYSAVLLGALFLTLLGAADDNWTLHMTPVPVKGAYTIRVVVEHEDLVGDKSVKLHIN